MDPQIKPLAGNLSLARLIDAALEEDIGHGDITTDSLITPDATGYGKIVAKQDLVIAGLSIALMVFTRLDPAVILKSDFKDGQFVTNGATILTVEGTMAGLLTAERTALNFLQRLSGIATKTRALVNQLKNSETTLVDTRKTTPGLRVLEKYAVRMGGAGNHRMGLYDGVLIKDNHIAACGGIKNAVAAARLGVSHLVKIEVEVSDFNQLRQALEAEADIIMLDNMGPEKINKAVALVDGRAKIEVSGNITADNIAQVAKSGVDLISVGALTHSAVAVDLSMKIETAS
jgi:nicotinate-nucleotide pyrophosphorylase (carboxylating)